MQAILRPMARVLVMILALLPTLPAQAALVGNDQIVQQTQLAYDKQQLRQLLDREQARQQLLQLGVDPDVVAERIDGLTDAELAQLNQRLEQLPAGGDVLGTLLVVFIVFVITDVIGATDIFPFIHPVR